MQFSDTSNLTGLIQDCEQKLFGDNGYGQISGDTNRLKHFTNLINRGYDHYVSLALGADGRWQFDDTNYTDYPIGLTNLVANQQSYVFADEHIMVLGVEIQDEAGNWTALREIDQQDFQVSGRSITEWTKDTAGIPTQYDKVANAVFLYPKPDYSQNDSLRVRFQRGPSYFVHGDTTKKPGFNSMHHSFLSLYAVMQYAIEKQLTSKNDWASLVQRWETVEIPRFYSRRAKDVQTVLQPEVTSSR